MEKMTNVKALAFAIENGNFPTEVVEKLTAIKTSYENKTTNKKPTANQKENEAIKTQIVEFLEKGGTYTATEVMKGIGLESIQKVSALLSQLTKAEVIVKTVDKKKALFSAKAE